MRRLAKEYMRRDLTCATEEMSIREVAELLSVTQIFGLPVVNKFNQVVGFISEKTIIETVFPERIDTDHIVISLDKFMQIVNRTEDIERIKVRSIMHMHIYTVTEETMIVDVVELILNKNLHIVPVVRDGFLVGTISRASVCKFLIDSNQV
jgi:predicted transcriptional regulator